MVDPVTLVVDFTVVDSTFDITVVDPGVVEATFVVDGLEVGLSVVTAKVEPTAVLTLVGDDCCCVCSSLVSISENMVAVATVSCVVSLPVVTIAKSQKKKKNEKYI